MIGVEGKERALGFRQLFGVRASGKCQTSQKSEQVKLLAFWCEAHVRPSSKQRQAQR
jgi:hypothetical protein